jgi:hypothetical protein
MNLMGTRMSLATFQAITNIWGTLQPGVPIWQAWGYQPMFRACVRVLAGIACANMCEVWTEIERSARLAKQNANPLAIPHPSADAHV